MKKLLTCIVVVAGIISGAHAQDSTGLTLQQCIDLALKNNIGVNQSALQSERAGISAQQAKSNVLPDLNGNAGFGWNQGRTIDPFTNTYINQQLSSSSIGLNSNVVLFSGLQLHNAIKQTALAFEASQKELEQAKNTLTVNVILTYLQILNAEDLLAIAKSQAQVTRKQVERMQVLVREGVIGQYQLSDLNGQLAGEELNIINSENSLQVTRLSLCQMMNIPMNSNLQLKRGEMQTPAGLYEQGAGQIYQTALADFAAIKATDLRVKSFEKQVKVAQSRFFPTLSFGANIGSNYSSAALQAIPGSVFENSTGQYVKVNGSQFDVFKQDQNFSFSKVKYFKQIDNNLGNYYGFQLQVPLFNKLSVRNQVKAAKIDLKDAQLENESIKLALRQNIETAYLNMASNFERFKKLTSQASDFEISFNAAEIRFNTGVINAAEYLLVKNNLDRARMNLITASYEYLLRTKILDFYQGRLSW